MSPPISELSSYSCADKIVLGWYNISRVLVLAWLASGDKSRPNKPLSAKNLFNIILKYEIFVVALLTLYTKYYYSKGIIDFLSREKYTYFVMSVESVAYWEALLFQIRRRSGAKIGKRRPTSLKVSNRGKYSCLSNVRSSKQPAILRKSNVYKNFEFYHVTNQRHIQILAL